MIEAGFELGDGLGELILVGFLAALAAKLMAKVPSANQAKRPAAMITPCLHGATAFVAVPSMIKVSVGSSPRLMNTGRGDLARGRQL